MEQMRVKNITGCSIIEICTADVLRIIHVWCNNMVLKFNLLV